LRCCLWWRALESVVPKTPTQTDISPIFRSRSRSTDTPGMKVMRLDAETVRHVSHTLPRAIRLSVSSVRACVCLWGECLKRVALRLLTWPIVACLAGRNATHWPLAHPHHRCTHSLSCVRACARTCRRRSCRWCTHRVRFFRRRCTCLSASSSRRERS
jgi:hypothetical protein